ncbi:MAG TPA: flavin reductase family protein [Desulfotomaculum sp.]|nr:flavin reductase family protein [Desulfotomaculum sp.]
MTKALGQLPWPVTLIGSFHDGRHNLMTASWVSQVSFSPPLVMVSIAPERYTHELIAATGEFVISILTAEQVEIARFCGSHSGRTTDKVKALGLKTAPGERGGVPVLTDCLANIECRVTTTYPAGDHTLFIGEVLGGSVMRPDADPLVIRDWEWGRYLKV